ncbi:periplasmic sensor hybrid histidine kinase [Magnetococcus marinus MC-1]|uniref:Sensory/regulatory protein RpfC n=1 Tax=Magnetococcus marinus (strain ATCC BAA-1437 / JCM 17883 / MC-1) TaxID=156889 RepID=A0LA77_MAGMM|nr:response regulator [Magnetococcus marinus]ABK44870.1 periplasmic sensor hybrid histidine kinase [Magnetococcus marinus MC-1]
MAFVQRLSIHQKLTLMAVGATLVALLFSASAYMARDYWGRRGALETQYRIQAQLMAQSLQAALVFNDAPSATDLLSALKADGQVHSAWLYDLRGEVFSRYVRANLSRVVPPTPGSLPMSGYRFGKRLLDLAVPVTLQGERVGLFYLRVDLKHYWSMLWQDLYLTLLFLLLAVSAAYVIAQRMHRFITTPIQALAAVAQQVSREQDYAARAPQIHTRDELQLLVEGFNGMLDEIGRQDDALRQHRDSLEAQVALRTTELTVLNGELATARDQALESVRLKSEFLATMSHEISTPMNGVVGMLELLDEKTLSPQQQEYVEIAKHSAEALLAIINDILDFSKVEAGHLVLESIPFQPLMEMEEVVALLAPRAQDKGVALVTEAQWQVLPGQVVGDPLRFRQVLTNLIGNAIKFTQQGEVVVALGWQAGQGTAGVLHFSVKDTGVGIDADTQKKLFQVFTQADGSTTRRFGGSGLGLAISRQLIELQGGQIGVESDLGQGAHFFFSVPMLAAAAPILEPYMESGLADPNRPVWLLERHEAAATALQALLHALGLSSQRLDGLSAILTLGKEPPPLVLINLNDSARPDVLSWLLAHPQVCSRYEIALMGWATSLQEARHHLGESVHYLPKPVRLGEITRLLQQRIRAVPDAPAQPLPLRGQLLVVEDNPVNQKVALAMLSGMGVSVQIVSSGAEALQWLQKQAFDLVLMDLHMPTMNGIETCRQLRQWEQQQGRQSVAVVALTASQDLVEQQHCLDAGMADFLSKPLSVEQLYQALARWLPPQSAPATPVVPLSQLLSEQAMQGLQAQATQGASRALLELWLRDTDQVLQRLPTLLESPAALMPLLRGLQGGAQQVGALEMERLGDALLRWSAQPPHGMADGALLIQRLRNGHTRLQQAINTTL